MATPEIAMLMEMGFPKEKAETALSATGNRGVEPAMEWLLSNSEDQPTTSSETPAAEGPKVDSTVDNGTADSATTAEDSEAASTEEASAVEDDGTEAKSLKCDECNKLFKSQLEVEYHAAKTSHSRFSESTEEKKPLTEEQRKEQLKLIEEKMKQKRKEREEKEKSDALEKEKKRIQSGKEMAVMREKMKEDEMKKMIEQRKREKIEDQKARQRVRDQIEADRAARRAKFGGGESAAQSETPLVTTPPVTSPPKAQPTKDYSEARLQIRLTNGQALTHTFGSKEQLSAVRLYVEMNRTDGSGPFSLMTNFPKKVFDDEDFDKPLEALGLAPSAVVIVSRKI